MNQNSLHGLNHSRGLNYGQTKHHQRGERWQQKAPANYNTSTTSQQLRILDWLLIRKIINTFESRDILDVAHPAGVH
jgi:hypothetical protein